MFSYTSLYKQLGNLFYAVATADEKISAAEKNVMSELVRYFWKHLEDSTDSYGTDAANIILFQFDVNEENCTASEEAFRQFEQFFTANTRSINHYLREKIMNSARRIASSSRFTNHDEMEMLLRLKSLLDIPVGAI
jgi:hypothetical protein